MWCTDERDLSCPCAGSADPVGRSLARDGDAKVIRLWAGRHRRPGGWPAGVVDLAIPDPGTGRGDDGRPAGAAAGSRMLDSRPLSHPRLVDGQQVVLVEDSSRRCRTGAPAVLTVCRSWRMANSSSSSRSDWTGSAVEQSFSKSAIRPAASPIKVPSSRSCTAQISASGRRVEGKAVLVGPRTATTSPRVLEDLQRHEVEPVVDARCQAVDRGVVMVGIAVPASARGCGCGSPSAAYTSKVGQHRHPALVERRPRLPGGGRCSKKGCIAERDHGSRRFLARSRAVRRAPVRGASGPVVATRTAAGTGASASTAASRGAVRGARPTGRRAPACRLSNAARLDSAGPQGQHHLVPPAPVGRGRPVEHPGHRGRHRRRPGTPGPVREALHQLPRLSPRVGTCAISPARPRCPRTSCPPADQAEEPRPAPR